MNTLRKIFGGLKMSWPKVVIFAIIIGIYTGTINQVAALENTSFRDIAVSLEVWVLFALIIVTNCKSPLEAGLKCGVFFLISQPLVYLVEMPSLGYFPWGYYRYWFILTLLTFPGGALAYVVKQKNLWGTLVLSMANCLLIMLGMSYAKIMVGDFPHHLLTLIYCFVITVLFVLILQPGKKERILGLAIIVLTAVISFGYFFGLFPGAGGMNGTFELGLPNQSEWTCVLEDPSLGEATVTDEDTVLLQLNKQGSTRLICTDGEGNQFIYDVSAGSDHLINCVPEE